MDSKTRRLPSPEERGVKAASSTCLDGEYCGTTKYYQINYIDIFWKTSKHAGKGKKVYFTNETKCEIVLVRNPIPKTDKLTHFKTPGLKTPRDYDDWSSCTRCSIVSAPDDKRTIYTHGLAGMNKSASYKKLDR